MFNSKRREELINLYLVSYVSKLGDFSEEFIKRSIEEFDVNPLYCVFLPSYTWQCGLNYTDISLPTPEDSEIVLALENNIRGDIDSVLGDRYVISDGN